MNCLRVLEFFRQIRLSRKLGVFSECLAGEEFLAGEIIGARENVHAVHNELRMHRITQEMPAGRVDLYSQS